MEILRRKEASKRWEQDWAGMHHEWFKLEVFQDYAGEDNRPSLRAYLAGDPTQGLALLEQEAQQSPWRERCRQKRDQGVLLRRVRILETPHSPYTAWELEYYRLINKPGGEQVFVIDKENISGLDLPDGDLMMFDNQRVVVNTYDETMRMDKQTFYDENDNIAGFLALKESLLAMARPL